jgi:hypothetical protein
MRRATRPGWLAVLAWSTGLGVGAAVWAWGFTQFTWWVSLLLWWWPSSLAGALSALVAVAFASGAVRRLAHRCAVALDGRLTRRRTRSNLRHYILYGHQETLMYASVEYLEVPDSETAIRIADQRLSVYAAVELWDGFSRLYERQHILPEESADAA